MIKRLEGGKAVERIRTRRKEKAPPNTRRQTMTIEAVFVEQRILALETHTNTLTKLLDEVRTTLEGVSKRLVAAEDRAEPRQIASLFERLERLEERVEKAFGRGVHPEPKPEEIRPKRWVSGWVNVYPNGRLSSQAFRTEAEARKFADHARVIDCVRIEWGE